MSSLSAGMKVSTRLALGMGAVVILGMVIVIFGALTMRSLSKDVDELARNRMVKVARFTDVLDNFNLIARQVRNVVITTDPAYQQELKSKIAEARTKNTATLAELDKDISAPNSRALFNIITEKRKAFNEASDRAIELAIKGDRASRPWTIPAICSMTWPTIWPRGRQTRRSER